MYSMADFFRPLDPFSKEPDWAVKDFPDLGYSLSLRPVYIPDDLRSLQRWVRAPATSINTADSRNQGRLLRQYKRILFSSRCQSFIVLNGENPVCQFDLRGTETDPLYFLLPTRPDDRLLTCLIPAVSLNSKIWMKGLTLLLEIFFGLPDSGYIFISAPRYPRVFTDDLETLGFESYREIEEMDPQAILLLKRNEYE